MFLALYNPTMSPTIHTWRIIAKGVALFLMVEFAFYVLPPNLQRLNVYNSSLKRQRFPISTAAPEDDALDVGDLDAMFASHIVSEPKALNEYRVLVLGDSAVWGIGLTPQQTLPGQMDELGLTCGNKDIRVYNLSFPRSSATKDLMILDKAMSYQPDKIIWLITWYTLMPKTRNDHPLITQNPEEFYKLAQRYDFLPKNYKTPSLPTQITDQHRTLFRVLRYQLYSLVNIATGLDQIPGPPEELPSQLSSDATFEGMRPPTLDKADVSLDQVRDFYQIAGSTPVVLINEPMLVLTDVPNSNIRYNDYYPRWVYDQYRQYMSSSAAENHWDYLDFWDVFPPNYYTDTPLHLIPEAEAKLAKMIAPAIVQGCP
ncbi:MAG TPA: SGNH/GDSL hydrolase family protein [Anaerolineales bacterium]|nr:SGNH/GDSL hydrolase family protein [Anaerolineales bacterium]